MKGVHRALVFRLEPTGAQRHLFARTAGCTRWVYNWGLQRQRNRYALDGKRYSTAQLCRLLTVQKQDPQTAWLCEAPAQCLQQALHDLGTAYVNFFADLSQLNTGALCPRAASAKQEPTGSQLALF